MLAMMSFCAPGVLCAAHPCMITIMAFEIVKMGVFMVLPCIDPKAFEMES